MNDEENNKKEEENLEQEDVVFEENYENTGKDAQEEIKKLKEKIKECEKTKNEYMDGWQRAKAEFVNLRKRDEEANKEFLKFAKEDIIKQLIPVLDSFEIAFSNKEEWEKTPKEWRTGIESIHSQLIKILEHNHVKQINPIGETFDPKFHDSVQLVKVSDKEKDNKVTEVVQKGYILYDKVIRTAKVKIGEYEEA
jgi:molecular chaperone GrpE